MAVHLTYANNLCRRLQMICLVLAAYLMLFAFSKGKRSFNKKKNDLVKRGFKNPRFTKSFFFCNTSSQSGGYYPLPVLEWVRTRESGSESESTRSESESESESIRPESESIRCESESIGPECESESESIRPESESESESSGSESESESVSPTEAWTHESNNRKVLYFNPSFNHFAEPCIDNW